MQLRKPETTPAGTLLAAGQAVLTKAQNIFSVTKPNPWGRAKDQTFWLRRGAVLEKCSWPLSSIRSRVSRYMVSVDFGSIFGWKFEAKVTKCIECVVSVDFGWIFGWKFDAALIWGQWGWCCLSMSWSRAFIRLRGRTRHQKVPLLRFVLGLRIWKSFKTQLFYSIFDNHHETL